MLCSIVRAFSSLSFVCGRRLRSLAQSKPAHSAAHSLRNLGGSLYAAYAESLDTDFEPTAASSNCSKPGPHTPHWWLRSLWSGVRQGSFNVSQERSSAAADPINVMSSCRPNPREFTPGQIVGLRECNFQTQNKHNLHSPRTLPSAPGRAVHRPTILTSRCQNFVSQGSRCARTYRCKLRTCGASCLQACGTVGSATGVFPSQSAAQHRHLVPAWVPPPCHWPILELCARSVPAASGELSPKLVGSTP